jgi:tetratricopeptide (TPR) repeat protein
MNSSEIEAEARRIRHEAVSRGYVDRARADACLGEFIERLRKGDPALPAFADLLLLRGMLTAERHAEIVRALPSVRREGGRGGAIAAAAGILGVAAFFVWNSARQPSGSNVPAAEWVARAERAAREGRPEEGIALLTRALAAGVREPEVWRARAALRERREDLDGAAADCSEALARDPEDAEALALRGWVLARKKDVVGALSDLDRLVARRASEGRAYRLRGRARLELGDAAGAVLDFTRALELDAGDVEAYLGRARARRERRDLAAAAADASHAIERDPRRADAWLLRGRLRHEAGDAAGAAADLEEALRAGGEGWPERSEAEELLRRLRP